MSNSKHVFLSYSPEDATLAATLAKLMTQNGASVFSNSELSPGDVWSEVFRRRLEDSSALIFLIPSENGLNRNSVLFEAGAAKALGKRVLAVLPPGRKTTQLPSDVADILILDTGARPLGSIAETLLQAAPENNTPPAFALSR